MKSDRRQATKLRPANEAEKMRWMPIVQAARKHPGGITAYCDENHIQVSTFYMWRTRIRLDRPDFDSSPTGAPHKKKRFLAPVQIIGQRTETKKGKIKICLDKGHVITLPLDISPELMKSIFRAVGVI